MYNTSVRRTLLRTARWLERPDDRRGHNTARGCGGGRWPRAACHGDDLLSNRIHQADLHCRQRLTVPASMVRSGKIGARRTPLGAAEIPRIIAPLQSRRSHPFRGVWWCAIADVFCRVVISAKMFLELIQGTKTSGARIGAEHTGGNWVYTTCGKMRSVWTVGTFVGTPHQNGGKWRAIQAIGTYSRSDCKRLIASN